MVSLIKYLNLIKLDAYYLATVSYCHLLAWVMELQNIFLGQCESYFIQLLFSNYTLYLFCYIFYRFV